MDNIFEIGKMYLFTGLNDCYIHILDVDTNDSIGKIKSNSTLFVLGQIGKVLDKEAYVLKVLTDTGLVGKCAVFPKEMQLIKKKNNL
jgi:hypothetical protein